MRAVQVITTTGPSDIVVSQDAPAPEAGPGQVLVEVHAVGVSFPDLLLTKGQYQLRPEPPFTLGVDFAGVVVSGDGFEPGQRVTGVGSHGGAAELVVGSSENVFPLPDEISFDEAVALPMNYLTALFALDERGDLHPGETVLVHGAAGGVGTATIQVAKGLGATVIAVASTEEKRAFALAAGADHAIPVEGFKDAARELTGGKGVDVVMDVVGGSLFTDSLRSLAREGRVLVVGFAAGEGIPEVKVNRLLLTNTDVRGVGWGEYAFSHPGYMREQWARLVPMIESGVVKPPVGKVYPIDQFGQALLDMDGRAALGKLVVRIRD
ncbi:NADPH2:quinone reductase [Nocardioides sp. J9]|uniref:NADPH:quinone oxidoreductase family protein n=1 Tax=unclassified Nocardioides TaxID=2615069 RepID=UPI0004909C4D|nr:MULTISPECIES: NADPH:quinone oxidoreductase family protein [unclassified Nocardioides]TWH04681.1 NADPH2:quinone reductase [Nocardioides sp. J9]